MAVNGFRFHDARRNRTVCCSPTLLTVWAGTKGVGSAGAELLGGPFRLNPTPKTETELRDAYAEWILEGEPA